jgi:hypothetical protein
MRPVPVSGLVIIDLVRKPINMLNRSQTERVTKSPGANEGTPNRTGGLYVNPAARTRRDAGRHVDSKR